MSIIELNAIKTAPDIVHEYSPSIKTGSVPLVIDNGSYECRVGWAVNDSPLMHFRNIIAKPRKEKQKKDTELTAVQPIQIGNDIANIEAMRYQLRTQFDRNVVTHYHNQEQIFDYIFTHLSIDGDGRVPHPIVLTECFANPNYCRQQMSELLFECYDVPSVSYGVDATFSFNETYPSGSGLIISIGYHTIHIIPVLSGSVQSSRVRRINLGGFQMISFLHRLLQLKYPVHAAAILLSRVEWLLHNHCSVAYDYSEELKKWSTLEFYEKTVKKVQLPFNLAPATSAQTLTTEQKIEKKRELAKRLAEINARKREERLSEDRQKLQKLNYIKSCSERGENKEFQKKMKQNMISGKDELNKLIQSVSARIERMQQKQFDSNQSFPFEEKVIQVPQPPKDLSIPDWVTDTKQKRAAIIDRRNSRKQRKLDLAKRRTVAAQERMRIISHLARKEKGDDDFGMRDEDWDVYKVISKDGDSDSETENEKLIELEEILRHHDPTFEEPQNIQECAAESYQLHLGVESIRAPELMFQPNMIGSSEAGITETVNYVLKQFIAEEQLQLAENIYVTGGGAQFPGLKERLDREMMEIRPFQSPFNITIASNPSLDAWLSASKFANAVNFSDSVTTKNDYLEFGSEYFKEHSSGNRYFPTPASIEPNIASSQTSVASTSEATEKIEEEIFIEDTIID